MIEAFCYGIIVGTIGTVAGSHLTLWLLNRKMK